MLRSFGVLSVLLLAACGRPALPVVEVAPPYDEVFSVSGCVDSGKHHDKPVIMDCRITNRTQRSINIGDFNYVVYDPDGVKIDDRGMTLKLGPGETGAYTFVLGTFGTNLHAAKVVIRVD